MDAYAYDTPADRARLRPAAGDPGGRSGGADHRPAGGGRAGPGPEARLVLAAAGGVVGFGALALLVALVLATSNNSTRPAVVSPPLAPVTQTTTTAPAPPSAEVYAGTQRLRGTPAPVACRHCAADGRRLGRENGAVRACAAAGSRAHPVARTVSAPVPLIEI